VPALVLAGGPGWDTALPAVLATVPAGMPLLRPGYLPYADLPGFLGGAETVAYPSLGEGFGLPVLEAMACGAAVLTTRLLSLPEVGGDAVAYCEPDPVSVGDALAALHADPDRRARLGRAARERALGFTWDASAEVHLRAWRTAAAEAGA
jgi:glycosyltransferase involved in cell wall biosynthesis